MFNQIYQSHSPIYAKNKERIGIILVETTHFSSNMSEVTSIWGERRGETRFTRSTKEEKNVSPEEMQEIMVRTNPGPKKKNTDDEAEVLKTNTDDEAEVFKTNTDDEAGVHKTNSDDEAEVLKTNTDDEA